MADKQIAYCGYVKVLDNSAMTNTTTTNTFTNPTTNNYELTNRTKNYDNQTGTYMRGTAKESYSSGDYTNRGRVGYKDEFKTSSTVRVGDKSGYTEYYKQEKVTRVEYDPPSYSSGGAKGGKICGGGASSSGGGGGGKSYYNGGGSKGYKSYGPYGGGGKKYLN